MEVATWNCWSYSNERHEFCKSLRKDVLGLTELRNKHRIKESSRCWIPSELSKVDEFGNYVDPAGGVAIMLSPRMAAHYRGSGCVGSRIAWVRVKGPTCCLFIVVVYIPHKYRKTKPFASDTIHALDADRFGWV